jgi:hypothetical protein
LKQLAVVAGVALMMLALPFALSRLQKMSEAQVVAAEAICPQRKIPCSNSPPVRQ